MKAILLCITGLYLAGCGVATPQELAIDDCSLAYQQAFTAAVAADDVQFCLGDKPDPQFIVDALGGYCFMPHSADPADFSFLNETSFVTGCVDQFAQATGDVTDCAVLQGTTYPTSGIGATAYNNCVINYAGAMSDLSACVQLDVIADDPFGLADDEECIKVVAWSTHNPTLCDDHLQGTDVYDLCMSGATTP